MSIREKPTYLSTQVYRALWLIAKSKNTPQLIETPHSNLASPDEIADSILREHIQTNYPQLFEHQKKVDALEKELLKTL